MTWRSKKQIVVVGSSVEVELRSMVRGICELLWLKSLMKKLSFDQNRSTKLYCDNIVNIVHNLVPHDKIEHVEVNRHFIKEKLNEGVICTVFFKMGDQLDILKRECLVYCFTPFLTRWAFAISLPRLARECWLLVRRYYCNILHKNKGNSIYTP